MIFVLAPRFFNLSDSRPDHARPVSPPRLADRQILLVPVLLELGEPQFGLIKSCTGVDELQV